jgi:hypothetical protein
MNLRFFIIVLLPSLVKNAKESLLFKGTNKKSIGLKHLQFGSIHHHCNIAAPV